MALEVGDKVLIRNSLTRAYNPPVEGTLIEYCREGYFVAEILVPTKVIVRDSWMQWMQPEEKKK